MRRTEKAKNKRTSPKNNQIEKPPLNKIEKVVFTGLFGKYDYVFDFINEENISIIIAPNGSGKTTILNFINFLLSPFEENYEKIKNIPVQEVECLLSDGTTISYSRLPNKYIQHNNENIILAQNDNRAQLKEDFFKSAFGYKSSKPIIDEILSSGILVKAGSSTNFDNYFYRFTQKQNNEIREVNFLDEFNKAYTEDTNSRKDKIENIIKKANENIISQLRWCRTLKVNANLIRTNRIESKFENDTNLQMFISRFIEREISKTKDQNGLEKNYSIHKIIDTVYGMSFLIQAKSEILDLYEYCTDKESEMNEFKSKIELFKSIYDSRNRITNKTIKFSKKRGFVIYQDNKEIPLGCLSSGEVNDFALFYKTIFNVTHSSLFLIDEPEISLHIDWQENIIDYLLEIATLNNCQFIIVTHSPHIINSHYDLITKREVKVYGRK